VLCVAFSWLSSVTNPRAAIHPTIGCPSEPTGHIGSAHHVRIAATSHPEVSSRILLDNGIRALSSGPDSIPAAMVTVAAVLVMAPPVAEPGRKLSVGATLPRTVNCAAPHPDSAGIAVIGLG
jgi:hypothetical protein